MANHIRTLTVVFDTKIHHKEIPLFRGAVLKCMGDKANLLYHNHTGDETFRYAYPLIQYKRINGNAAVVCVENGVDVIGQYLAESSDTIRLGDREARLATSKIMPVRILVQTWKSSFRYHISRWLPLNAKNYQIYRMTDDDGERTALLENIMKGNLLSMLKGLDIHLEEELFVKITNLEEPYILYNKGVGMMAFNAEFISNLSIPNNVGIGKNASIGYGVVWQERQNNNKEKQHTT